MQPPTAWLVRICLLGALCSAAFAGGPRAASPFVIFDTGDAPGTLDSNKLSECLRLTLREMNLDGRELPRIAVYHISAEAGHYLGVDTNSNWRSTGGGHQRYEMWIVGNLPTTSSPTCSKTSSSAIFNCRWMKLLVRGSLRTLNGA